MRQNSEAAAARLSQWKGAGIGTPTRGASAAGSSDPPRTGSEERVGSTEPCASLGSWKGKLPCVFWGSQNQKSFCGLLGGKEWVSCCHHSHVSDAMKFRRHFQGSSFILHTAPWSLVWVIIALPLRAEPWAQVPPGGTGSRSMSSGNREQSRQSRWCQLSLAQGPGRDCGGRVPASEPAYLGLASAPCSCS